MGSTPPDLRDELSALTRAFREALARHQRAGAWAAPGGASARPVAGPSDAADLVQKTFLHVHRARKDYQVGRPVRPWIYTIALNVRREEGRRRLRRKEIAVDMQDPAELREPMVDPVASSASDRLVQRALMQLSEIQREVIVLHWYDGLSFPEIAELVGATVSAVKVRAHRGYGELRRILGER